MYTQTQMTVLRKYEYIFEAAVRHGYKKPTCKLQNDAVADIYEKATGKKVNRRWGCGICTFNLYKAAGELYYATRAAQQEKEEKKDTKPKTNGTGKKKLSNKDKVGRNTRKA